MNGHSLEVAPSYPKQHSPTRSVTPSTHLGKRKRSQSPEKTVINGDAAHVISAESRSIDSNVEDVLHKIRK